MREYIDKIQSWFDKIEEEATELGYRTRTIPVGLYSILKSSLDKELL